MFFLAPLLAQLGIGGTAASAAGASGLAATGSALSSAAGLGSTIGTATGSLLGGGGTSGLTSALLGSSPMAAGMAAAKAGGASGLIGSLTSPYTDMLKSGKGFMETLKNPNAKFMDKLDAGADLIGKGNRIANGQFDPSSLGKQPKMFSDDDLHPKDENGNRFFKDTFIKRFQ